MIPDARITANAPARQAELARLLTLPGVTEAMRAVKADYHAKAGELRQRVRAQAAGQPDDPALGRIEAALG